MPETEPPLVRAMLDAGFHPDLAADVLRRGTTRWVVDLRRFDGGPNRLARRRQGLRRPEGLGELPIDAESRAFEAGAKRDEAGYTTFELQHLAIGQSAKLGRAQKAFAQAAAAAEGHGNVIGGIRCRCAG